MNKIWTIACLACMAGCSQKTVDKTAEGNKILALSREWSRVAAERNVDKTVNYWADHAVVISAGQPVLTGKAAIRKMVEESYRMPGFRISWEPQHVEVSDSGDMAYLLENSRISFTDSTGQPVTVNNKAVSIWRKQDDGTWKNVVDISTPAAGQ